MNIALSAVEYQVALRRVNVSLPLSLVEELLNLIGQLKDAGKVRMFEDGKYSVLDFIENVVGKRTAREVWKRLQDKNPGNVTICDLVKFIRSDGRISPKPTPISTVIGVIVIAYQLPGELGDRLRLASAELVLETLSAYKNNLNALLTGATNEPTELDTLKAEVAKLRNQLYQAELNHNEFSCSAKMLHQVSQIVSFHQVKEAIKRDFVEGRDWVRVGKQIFTNESTYNILVISFRSLRGTDISQLPAIIKLETRLFFQYQENRRRAKNKRTSHRYTDGQLEIQYTY